MIADEQLQATSATSADARLRWSAAANTVDMRAYQKRRQTVVQSHTVAKGRRWKVPSRAAMMTTLPSLAHFSANFAMSAEHGETQVSELGATNVRVQKSQSCIPCADCAGWTVKSAHLT